MLRAVLGHGSQHQPTHLQLGEMECFLSPFWFLVPITNRSSNGQCSMICFSINPPIDVDLSMATTEMVYTNSFWY
jgi:hypothetical protein